MKPRIFFTLKILLPYLALLLVFILIFLGLDRADQRVLKMLCLVGMAGALLMGIHHLSRLRKSLNKVNRLMGQLKRGIIPGFEPGPGRDEVSELERSLEKHLSNLKKIASFSRSISRGDFTDHYEQMGPEDELGEALNKLKTSLMESKKESESRRRQEENRTWSAQGLAKFSSLFRDAEDNLQELSAQLMKELVDYTEADMGTLYIVRSKPGEDECLENSGSYAFDRKEEISRTFRFGEGLVGRAALEREVIYLKDLPPDYIKIRSGLGEDKPASVLLVPVVLDQQVLGVMELASLGEIAAYQIEFIRQLADALATTLAKVEANLKTRKLFEQTREQAEAHASQEKVFRKNIKQLEKELKEALQREEDLKKEIHDLRKGLN